jgi:hypothetical protein
MEQRLDRALLSVQRLTAALDEYVKVQEDILALEAYYGSNEWKQDFADDERQRAGDGNQKVPATEKDAQTPETDLQSTETAVQWPKDVPELFAIASALGFAAWLVLSPNFHCFHYEWGLSLRKPNGLQTHIII